MVGKLFIDGLDAFSEYGIFVEQYGYKALVQMPSFKKLSSTEWPEYDGEEVDLSDPSLIAKHFRFRFALPIFWAQATYSRCSPTARIMFSTL